MLSEWKGKVDSNFALYLTIALWTNPRIGMCLVLIYDRIYQVYMCLAWSLTLMQPAYKYCWNNTIKCHPAKPLWNPYYNNSIFTAVKTDRFNIAYFSFIYLFDSSLLKTSVNYFFLFTSRNFTYIVVFNFKVIFCIHTIKTMGGIFGKAKKPQSRVTEQDKAVLVIDYI